MKPIYFTPRSRYKVISLTGFWCALNCKFCNKRYLVNMVHTTPSNFIDTVRELYVNGVRGVLLSGGFRSNGTLPIEPYIDKLRVVKRELGIITSAHLGLITNKELLHSLRGLIDTVDFEFTLSSFIVNYVRGFTFSPKKYVNVLSKIVDSGLHIVPHIYAWHPEIRRDVLREELKIISDFGIKEIVLLVYIDPFKTHEHTKLASIVVDNIKYVRNTYPGRLYMGCMRPGYIKPLIDPVLVEKELVDRIVNPYYKVLKEQPGDIYDACCSIQLIDSLRELFLVSKVSNRNS